MVAADYANLVGKAVVAKRWAMTPLEVKFWGVVNVVSDTPGGVDVEFEGGGGFGITNPSEWTLTIGTSLQALGVVD